jgi:hypothetical protein
LVVRLCVVPMILSSTFIFGLPYSGVFPSDWLIPSLAC